MKNFIAVKLDLSVSLLLAFVMLTGCGKDQKQSTTTNNSATVQQPPAPLMPSVPASTSASASSSNSSAVLSPAKELLKQVTAKYRNAKSYADKAEAVRRSVQKGTEKKTARPLAIAMQRPNKLRVECYDVRMICDGKLIHGTIEDLVKNQNDILELPAPEKITHENAIIDDTMNYVLNVNMAGRPLQLLLLYSDDAYRSLIAQGEPTLLPEETQNGLAYQRIQFKSDDGDLTFWIEKTTQLIHRIDYPVKTLRTEMEKQYGPLDQLEFYIDFGIPKIDEDLPANTFEYSVPNGAPLVKRLLAVPPPVRPMPLLGKFSPDFEFVSLAGEKVTEKSLLGKVTVLTFWDIDPISKKYVELVDQVRERYKNSDKIQFCAVSVDDEKTTNAEIEKVVAQWKIDQAVVRDPKVDANKVLRIEIVPSLIVLDAEGKIQHHWPMLAPSLADELPPILDRLLDGKPTFEETLKDYELRLAEYRRLQQTPPIDTSANASTNPTASVPSRTKVTPTTVAPAPALQKYRLSKLWEKPNSDQLKQPGNMIVVEDSSVANGAVRILVLDGWKAVCEYNLQGEQIARHELELPEKTAASVIRTAVDGNGNRYFALFHPFSPQLFLYDTNWKKILTYPTTEQLGTDMVTDALLTDLDGNDELELAVGFSGTTGLQLVNLKGERIWANRTEAQYVIRLAATNPAGDKKRKLLCTNSIGSVVLFDQEGKAGTPWFIPDQRIVRIFGQANGETPWLVELNNPQGKNVVVGLSSDGIGRWHYLLPDGSFERPVEPYIIAQLTKPDANEWLLAAPNATIHLLDSNGKLIDQFPTGSNVFGLAGLNRDKKAILIYSNSAGITAQSLEPVESKESQK